MPVVDWNANELYNRCAKGSNHLHGERRDRSSMSKTDHRKTTPPERHSLRAAEASLERRDLDFPGTYMAVSNLQYEVGVRPDAVTAETVAVVEPLFRRRVHIAQRQAYFLYRKAANTLACIVVRTPERTIADKARMVLREVAAGGCPAAHKAAAEALGGLPFSPDDIPLRRDKCRSRIANIPTLHWSRLLERLGLRSVTRRHWMGRSLVVPGADGRTTVIKTVADPAKVAMLDREARWMEHLPGVTRGFDVPFAIPEPVRLEGKYVCRLKAMPAQLREGRIPGGDCHVICFRADPGYFIYPNDHRETLRPGMNAFRETLARNAWLLGRLAAMGIVHTAPIPLFHNRVQQARRNDGGMYQWFREGRLDRWLFSCRYPNMGQSGMRDFEHLEWFDGNSRQLYLHLGTHLLSLSLVAGSYFRNKNLTLCGLTPEGQPVDARALFDQELLTRVMREIFCSYYNGFTGTEFHGRLPFDPEELVKRMIEEMGVDRHMEEVLRVTDQQRMSEAGFWTFLKERGFTEREILSFEKGAADIRIATGPHLGGFNQRISLPELIRFTASGTACCVSDRFWNGRTTLQAGVSG
jgi:hypothetical protein